MTEHLRLREDLDARPRFDVGRIVGDAVITFRRRPLIFVLAACAAGIPLVVFDSHVDTGDLVMGSGGIAERYASQIANRAITGVCRGLLLALCTRWTLEAHLLGRASAPVSALWTRAPGVIVVSLIAVLVTTVGTLACVLPGLIAMSTFCLAPSVLATERVGVIDAIYRSAALTENRKLPLFGLLFTTNLLGVAAYFVAGRLLAPISQAAPSREVLVAAYAGVRVLAEAVSGLTISLLLAAAYVQLAFDPEARKLEADVETFS